MRIALVALHFAEYASRLAIALAARHEVLLVMRASNADDELTDTLRRQVCSVATVHCIGGRRWRDPRVFGVSVFANRAIRRFTPDVLHIQEGHPVLCGWTIEAMRKRVPVVLTVHDPIGHSGTLPLDAWQWRAILWLRRRVDRLIVHGPQMQTEMITLDRSLAERLDVIPHGILGHEPGEPDAGGHEPHTFLFFGRVEPYKGLEYLLDACRILQSRGRTPRVVIAGTGTDLHRHRRHIAALPSVELIDSFIPAEAVPALFRRAAAVVLPYTDATQSGVAAIALAASRPVIATAVGDLPDIVAHRRTGLIVPPCDAAALADAMDSLMGDGQLRNEMAQEAGRFARDRLSWPRIADMTELTLEQAIASRRERTGSRACVVDDAS